MSWLKNNKIELGILLIQIILCIVAFNKFWIDPANFMFMPLYDGVKNYFTLQSYMNQPIEEGLSMVMNHAYPFGDYLFYADLTPSIAFPMKLFSVYIYDISDYAIPIYNFIIIFLHLISILFVYKLIRYFVKTPWIAVVLSFCLAWTHPQFFRMMNGHMNLSVSVFILISILTMIHLYDGYTKDPISYFKKHKMRYVGVFVLLYIASFTHLYYLPILGIAMGAFAFVFFIQMKWFDQKSWLESLRPLLIIGGICLLALISVLGTIRLIDSYYDLRNVGNPSYGFDAWKMLLSSLFTARPFNSIQYLVSYFKPIHYESNLYLGAYFLYGLTLFVCLSILKHKERLPIRQTLKNKPITIIWLLVGFMCLFISMGDEYIIGKSGYKINNYLNPLLYVRYLSEQVEQFRCIARFFWPGFWVFSLAMAYLIDSYYRQTNKKIIRLSLVVLILFSISDTKDVIQLQNHTFFKNQFHPSLSICEQSPSDSIVFSSYQSILPLPYFNVGSEVWDYTIDGGKYYNREIFKYSLCSSLPMMSIQSSRLPIKHTTDFFSIFLNDKPNQDLLDLMNHKPVLVLYHKGFHRDIENNKDFKFPRSPYAQKIIRKGKELPQKYGMTKIGENDAFIFYAWDISLLKDPS
jgi:hypothetical protein